MLRLTRKNILEKCNAEHPVTRDENGNTNMNAMDNLNCTFALTQEKLSFFKQDQKRNACAEAVIDENNAAARAGRGFSMENLGKLDACQPYMPPPEPKEGLGK
jgi:hypothetical protein